MDKINFAQFADINASNVNIDGGMDELPAGNYNVEILDMGITPSKSDGVTPVLKTHFRVLTGTFANQHLFNNLVLIKRDERDGSRISRAINFLRSMGLVDSSVFRWIDLPSLDAQVDQLFGLIQKSRVGFSLELSYKAWKNRNGETVNYPQFKISGSFSLDNVPPVYDSLQQQNFAQPGYAQPDAGFGQNAYAQQAPQQAPMYSQPMQQQAPQPMQAVPQGQFGQPQPQPQVQAQAQNQGVPKVQETTDIPF